MVQEGRTEQLPSQCDAAGFACCNLEKALANTLNGDECFIWIKCFLFDLVSPQLISCSVRSIFSSLDQSSASLKAFLLQIFCQLLFIFSLFLSIFARSPTFAFIVPFALKVLRSSFIPGSSKAKQHRFQFYVLRTFWLFGVSLQGFWSLSPWPFASDLSD